MNARGTFELLPVVRATGCDLSILSGQMLAPRDRDLSAAFPQGGKGR